MGSDSSFDVTRKATPSWVSTVNWQPQPTDDGDVEAMIVPSAPTQRLETAGLVPRMSDEDWDQVLSTNLRSVFLFTRAVTQVMMRQRTGRIINMSSVSGIMGNPGQANYSASKAGVIGLTRTVARELAGFIWAILQGPSLAASTQKAA